MGKLVWGEMLGLSAWNRYGCGLFLGFCLGWRKCRMCLHILGDGVGLVRREEMDLWYVLVLCCSDFLLRAAIVCKERNVRTLLKSNPLG